jgi:hypothetical protein
MTQSNRSNPEVESTQTRPWYRYPWPWIAISIPAMAVVGGFFTLYLAITHPDPLVVDEGRYQEVRAELQAQPQVASPSTSLAAPQTPATTDERDHDEREH